VERHRGGKTAPYGYRARGKQASAKPSVGRRRNLVPPRLAPLDTAEHAAVAVAAPTTIRGSAFGLLAAVQSFGNLAASGIAGLIWTLVSPEAAFVYIAAWMLVALAGLAISRAN
jgi:hypothetical protein